MKTLLLFNNYLTYLNLLKFSHFKKLNNPISQQDTVRDVSSRVPRVSVSDTVSDTDSWMKCPCILIYNPSSLFLLLSINFKMKPRCGLWFMAYLSCVLSYSTNIGLFVWTNKIIVFPFALSYFFNICPIFSLIMHYFI